MKDEPEDDALVHAFVVMRGRLLIDKDQTKYMLQDIIQCSCGSEENNESPKKRKLPILVGPSGDPTGRGAPHHLHLSEQRSHAPTSG